MAESMTPKTEAVAVAAKTTYASDDLQPLNLQARDYGDLDLLPAVPQPLARDEQLGPTHVTAQTGDSAWAIAARQNPGASNETINTYKNKLLTENPWLGNSNLRPGDRVKLPTAYTLGDLTRAAALDQDTAARALRDYAGTSWSTTAGPPEFIGEIKADPGWLDSMAGGFQRIWRNPSNTLSILGDMVGSTGYYYRNSNNAQAITQIAGGVTEGLGAVGVAQSGVGLPLAFAMVADAADNAFTGVKRLVSGEPEHTAKYELVRAIGGSHQFAQDVETGTSILLGVGGGAHSINQLAAGTNAGAINLRTFGGDLDAPNTETVRVFRVEGAGNQRLFIDAEGNFEIPEVLTNKGRGAERNLYLNFGDEARAQEFLQQRLQQFPDNTIKSFEVPKSFVDELNATAVEEPLRPLYPNRPVIADPTKASNQFGLSQQQIEQLRKIAIKGTGKVH